MKNLLRLPALFLSLALLAGCGPVRTEPLAVEPEGPEALPENTIAYVPLDDRPDNVERPVYLAESLGYTLAMPETALYRTALDGQPKNFDSLQRGEPWSLYTWVLEQEAAGCDRYIISLDQMHSGGLVSSRSMTGDQLELPGGGYASASQLLADLLAKLAEDGDNVVWLLDSVMRLAPTVGYQDGTVELYDWIRAFGAQPRATLEGDDLTIENILESYWLGPDGEELYDKVAEEQGAVAADDYYGPYRGLADNMDSRERKLRLSDEVQNLLAQPGYENFRLLIGIDDSSLEDCIQKNEIAYLRQSLRTDEKGNQLDWLLSGVDDLAFKAVAKLFLEEQDWHGEASLHYFGGTEDRPACAYDFQPLTEIMAEHFAFFHLTEAEDAAGTLRILVLTQPLEEGKKKAYCNAVIDELARCRKAETPVILVDAGNNAYGTDFHRQLTKKAELGWLLSYAGFLDMAIVTGTALSHGVARYAYLEAGDASESAHRAFARTLADSVIKDFCYRNLVREEILACARDELGGDPNNFWNPPIDLDTLVSRLEAGMDRETRNVVKNFERSSFITGLDPYQEAGWGGVALTNYRFPWDRAFEMGMDILLGEFTEPHEKTLGIYTK